MDKTVNSVDAYIAAQPAAVRPALEKMRATLRRAIPGADEVISYGMPAYKLGGHVVVYFAGWKQHTALYPAGSEAIAAFAGELAAYETSKGAIRFALDAPLPLALIARIAEFRARQVVALNAARPAAKKMG